MSLPAPIAEMPSRRDNAHVVSGGGPKEKRASRHHHSGMEGSSTTSTTELEIDREVHQEAREPGSIAGKPSQGG